LYQVPSTVLNPVSSERQKRISIVDLEALTEEQIEQFNDHNRLIKEIPKSQQKKKKKATPSQSFPQEAQWKYTIEIEKYKETQVRLVIDKTAMEAGKGNCVESIVEEVEKERKVPKKVWVKPEGAPTEGSGLY